MKIFFCGLHHPNHAGRVPAACISVNRLLGRKKPLPISNGYPWILDSGAFTTLIKYKGYPASPEAYAVEVKRWGESLSPPLAAVSQDYMCESAMLKLTGLTVLEHQELTIHRYDILRECDLGGVYLLPVIQGYEPSSYVEHLNQYGDRLQEGIWVGVGSVCKRNSNPIKILEVLKAIHDTRPDLRLHGFGVKLTALMNPEIRELLYSSDSMAWSFAARRDGRDANSWVEALAYSKKVYGIIGESTP